MWLTVVGSRWSDGAILVGFMSGIRRQEKRVVSVSADVVGWSVETGNDSVDGPLVGEQMDCLVEAVS